MAFLQKYLLDNAIGGTHGSHSVYWITSDVFNQLPIKPWKFNRPPDVDRITEINRHMNETKRMDGIIYLACIDNEIVCYESNHRREALRGLEGMNPLLVDIIWDANDEKIKSEFIRLNKAVSVPELYIAEETDVVITGIKEAVDKFCENYASHKVGSNRPQRPNFNRDTVIDEFYRIMKENRIGIDELVTRLQRLNKEMTERDKSKLPQKVIDKCEKSGLWLFAWSSKLNANELLM
jgi:hypothetical protein